MKEMLVKDRLHEIGQENERLKVQIEYWKDCHDVLKTENEELKDYKKAFEDGAKGFKTPIPKLGSDTAKLLVANLNLCNEFDKLQSEIERAKFESDAVKLALGKNTVTMLNMQAVVDAAKDYIDIGHRKPQSAEESQRTALDFSTAYFNLKKAVDAFHNSGYPILKEESEC